LLILWDMTQLDSITWLPQIIWLFFIFFLVFRLVEKIFGPNSYFMQTFRLAKIRSHYMSAIYFDFLNVNMKFKRFNGLLKIF